ncbi:putative carbonyl reductase [Rosellinia necatrix]|uniref:Putative carbonyl reductase n=1 Tax=Rosellinia necatrix TaxID=77044 RepID=A0A1W2TJD2_ROSNE|nr:putative carbonyl reductase [Rosellinia necatrix]
MGQPPIPPTPVGTNLTGKTIIVTGGNAGIGYESARQFLELGASRVILACRSVSRGQEAVATLRADPVIKKVNPKAVIEVFELDLDDYQSGLEFANRVKREVEQLDLLLNNGGTAMLSYERSKSGHERMMQVNCYTHVLVCLALFPLLRSTAAARGAPTRITWVGSSVHKAQHSLRRRPVAAGGSVLRHFDDAANFHRAARYADSKLAVGACARRLAAVAPAEVLVNSVCPGFVQTTLDRGLPFYVRPVMALARRALGRLVGDGARAVVHASAVAGPETNGMFLQNNEIDLGVTILDEAVGQAFIDKLWAETVEDVASLDPTLALYS